MRLTDVAHLRDAAADRQTTAAAGSRPCTGCTRPNGRRGGGAVIQTCPHHSEPVRPERTVNIVSSGIYRLSRNPMYLGMACILTGWAVWLWQVQAVLGVVLFVAWITRFQIIPEERILTQKFGTEYRHYRQQVRRWV
ncbi:Putative protein-S-isoprenylcysteine methyltransferase [Rothia dentocariosa]|uniref:Isoprenylcysteine carboxylmethyltransferase family protein n=1 Tax=Rothia dentocariosa TaxID=2047 RepID=A0A3S5C164_9MICC|nr:Putative protein-S-isoprenylcysteine methyltransferase [Rothia dentocariosa]